MRQYLIGSWNNADTYDYSGEQLMGNRHGQSRRVHFNPNGTAAIQSYGDEKEPQKKTRSIAEKILPQSVRYDNLCNLMSELESQKGSMCSEDYYQYHAILKAKIDRQWVLLSKAAGWTEHLPENPVKKSAQTSTQNTDLLHENEAKNDDRDSCVLPDEQNMFYTPVKLFCEGINFYKSLDKAWKDGIYFISASTMMLIGFKVLF